MLIKKKLKTSLFVNLTMLDKLKKVRCFNLTSPKLVTKKTEKSHIKLYQNSFLWGPEIKNRNSVRPQLKIAFKSYGTSQINDIKLSVAVVVKLIHYLNYFCTKQLKDLIYSRKQELIHNHLDTLDLVNTHPFIFTPCLLYTHPWVAGTRVNTSLKQGLTELENKNQGTEEAKTRTRKLKIRKVSPTLSKSGLLRKQDSNQSILCKLELQKNNYLNRYFFKWCQVFAGHGSINKQVQKPPHGTKLFTVIRSPFVFKKTREQFILQKQSYFIIVKLQNPVQKRFLIQCIGSLRLPAELEILDC